MIASIGALVVSSGCAVAWRNHDDLHQLGFAWTREGRSPCGDFVERRVPGLDLRIGTGDSGITLGWSRRLLATPGDGDAERDCWRYPRKDRASVGWVLPYRRLHAPRRTDAKAQALPTFLASSTWGLSLELNELRKSASLLFERSTLTATDPEHGRVCSLRYHTKVGAGDALDLFFFVERNGP